MNFDPLSPQLPPVPIPTRSVHTPPDQVSNRPVERPHHGEAADNQNRKDAPASETDKALREQPADRNRSVRQESELTPEEKRQVDKLKARDAEVRAHEAAHKNAAGQFARGGAQFSYETGPDGRRYAVGGEVSIDTSKVNGDPEATLRKAQVIRRAAQAPVQPSAQDYSVAAQASRMEVEARAELAQQRVEERKEQSSSVDAVQSTVTNGANEPQPAVRGSTDADTQPIQPVVRNAAVEPAPVGTLLDVLA